MERWFNKCKSLNVIQHINRSKDNTHMIISIDTGKSFGKIQYPFLIKTLLNLGIERMYLNIIKTIYDNRIANIILNGEKVKPFPFKPRMNQWCSLSPVLFNIILEFLVREIRQEEEIKDMQIRKEVVKQSLFADNMILYVKEPKNSTPKLPDIINSFTKVEEYKINLQNQPFCISKMNRLIKNIGKQFHVL
jgi:hypothetical protein